VVSGFKKTSDAPIFAPNETEGLRGLGKQLGPGPDYPGLLIGFWVAGHVSDYYATPAGHQWQSIWLFPAFFSQGTDSPL